MTCTDGIYIDDRRIEVGDCSGPQSARAILLNPKVEAAVLECARGGILRAGPGLRPLQGGRGHEHRRGGPPRAGRIAHARET